MKTPEWAWREHGDMLALILRARTGYKIIRKRPPTLDDFRAKDLTYIVAHVNGRWLGVAGNGNHIVKRVTENSRFMAYVMLADGIRR